MSFVLSFFLPRIRKSRPVNKSKLLFFVGCMIGLAFGVTKGRVARAEKPLELDEDLVKRTYNRADGQTLLAYLRKQTGKDTDLLHLDKLISQLGESTPKVRRQASKKLIALGPCALPALLLARDDDCLNRVRNAKMCIKQINNRFHLGLPFAVVQRIERLKPAGTVETLLDFLPYVPDEETEEGIWYALDELTTHKGKVHRALLAAVTDKLWARRAVAGCLLGRRGNQDQKKSVRKLLADANAQVRLRTAQGFLSGK